MENSLLSVDNNNRIYMHNYMHERIMVGNKVKLILCSIFRVPRIRGILFFRKCVANIKVYSKFIQMHVIKYV